MCTKCGKIGETKSGDILPSKYEGLPVQLRGETSQCWTCVSEAFIQEMKHFSAIITVVEEPKLRIKVDWDLFIKAKNEDRESLTKLLLQCHILSSQPPGYLPMISPCFFPPQIKSLYFAQEEAAIEWMRQVYGKTDYPVGLCLIGKTIDWREKPVYEPS